MKRVRVRLLLDDYGVIAVALLPILFQTFCFNFGRQSGCCQGSERWRSQKAVDHRRGNWVTSHRLVWPGGERPKGEPP